MTKRLNDLNASDLARIDAICLDFETRLRRGESPSIDDLVAEHGGQHHEVLRQELTAVLQEIESPSGVTREETPFSSDALPNEQRQGASRSTVQSLASPPDGVLPGPGDSIGPYRIENELGRGGMGVVLRATDTRLDRAVAIKVLAIQGEHYEELAERFQREAKAVARITHPHVVELFDIGSHNGLPYVVMELLQGELLLDYQRRRRLSPAEVRMIGAQLADALATSHSFGVIHRDLKPQNVMLAARSKADASQETLVLSASSDAVQAVSNHHSNTGTSATSNPGPELQVKLFDFGLSRSPLRGEELTQASDGTSGSEIDTATRVGMIMGTPGYMAPEQARGEVVSPAADIFSLGCVLHEAFYGNRAFDGETPADRFAATLRETPSQDPIRRRDDPDLAEIIESCLAKDVDARPASAAQLANRLGADPTQLASANRFAPTPIDENGAVTAGSNDGTFSRRRFVEGVAGGMVGLSYAGWQSMTRSVDMRKIESIGVLSLTDADLGEPPTPLAPLGQRYATSGEQLAVSLVNALSQAEGLTVPRFSPLVATSPGEYIEAAEKLQVDALVDGDFRRLGDQSLEVDLRVTSGFNGKLLWADTVKVPAGDSLVERKVLAERLASEIGRIIQESDQDVSTDPPQDTEVFSCINKGLAALDPDREDALASSLHCYDHAVGLDGGFAEAQGGLATVALLLANRGGEPTEPDDPPLIKTASDALAAASQSNHPTVLLARAMYQWQIDHDYDAARVTLTELVEKQHNDWLAHHQLGMLLLTLGDDDGAIDNLERAARLASTVNSVQADVVRAFWFRDGGRQQAIDRAKVLLSRTPDDVHAKGVLIDLLEDQEDYRAAADVDDQFGEIEGVSPTTVSRDAYFARRKERLAAIPYGPFDPGSNRVIQFMRSNVILSESEQIVLRWQGELPPSMPYLLARHPALRALRGTEAAKRILPSELV